VTACPACPACLVRAESVDDDDDIQLALAEELGASWTLSVVGFVLRASRREAPLLASLCCCLCVD
jgi:hypothetical protein